MAEIGDPVRRERLLSDEERHYLGSILVRLNSLYEITEAPNIREQLQDEIGWLEEKLGLSQ